MPTEPPLLGLTLVMVAVIIVVAAIKSNKGK